MSSTGVASSNQVIPLSVDKQQKDEGDPDVLLIVMDDTTSKTSSECIKDERPVLLPGDQMMKRSEVLNTFIHCFWNILYSLFLDFNIYWSLINLFM